MEARALGMSHVGFLSSKPHMQSVRRYTVSYTTSALVACEFRLPLCGKPTSNTEQARESDMPKCTTKLISLRVQRTPKRQ